MLAHASPEFLRRHIPKMLSGEDGLGAVLLRAERGLRPRRRPDAADRDGDRWILNGAKIWSTGAAYADYGMCLARTDWDVPKHQGLTWFAVRCDAPGVTVQPIREINGGADFCQEFFDDVELSDDDVIGEVNNGWAVTQTMLIYERGGGAGEWWSPGRRARSWRCDRPAHARTRPRRPRGAGRSRATIRRSASSSPVPTSTTTPRPTSVVGSASSSRAAATRRAPRRTASSPRACSTRSAPGSRSRSVAPRRCSGSPATSRRMAASLNYLNGRIMSIAGGTNEMQRNGIGERVLGLPREPSFDSNKPFRQVVAEAAQWTGKVG